MCQKIVKPAALVLAPYVFKLIGEYSPGCGRCRCRPSVVAAAGVSRGCLTILGIVSIAILGLFVSCCKRGV